MREHTTNLYICTDDGSYGEKCFGNAKLEQLIQSGRDYDEVFIIGPLKMMKFTSLTTKPYNIKTIASLCPIMIDASGMCGGCRLTVGGEVKFACVDGPEFDAHEVDWDEIIARNAFYAGEEKEATNHICRLTGGVRHG
jgi:ferredoxin--NADP+ reductase